MVKKQQKVPLASEVESTNSTILGELLLAQGFCETVQHDTPNNQTSKDPPAMDTGGIRLEKMDKLVLRHERKGRGGKTVTLISGFIAAPPQIEALARIMRKALGVGATVEKGVIIMQGDVTTRAAEWLKKHGARQVVIGN